MHYLKEYLVVDLQFLSMTVALHHLLLIAQTYMTI